MARILTNKGRIVGCYVVHAKDGDGRGVGYPGRLDGDRPDFLYDPRMSEQFATRDEADAAAERAQRKLRECYGREFSCESAVLRASVTVDGEEVSVGDRVLNTWDDPDEPEAGTIVHVHHKFRGVDCVVHFDGTAWGGDNMDVECLGLPEGGPQRKLGNSESELAHIREWRRVTEANEAA